MEKYLSIETISCIRVLPMDGGRGRGTVSWQLSVRERDRNVHR